MLNQYGHKGIILILYIEQYSYIFASLVTQISNALSRWPSPAGRYIPEVQETFILLPVNARDFGALTNLLPSQHFCQMQPLVLQIL